MSYRLPWCDAAELREEVVDIGRTINSLLDAQPVSEDALARAIERVDVLRLRQAALRVQLAEMGEEAAA